MSDTDAEESANKVEGETPEEGALRRLQVVIDECDSLQAQYDRLRAEGAIARIDFMERCQPG